MTRDWSFLLKVIWSSQRSRQRNLTGSSWNIPFRGVCKNSLDDHWLFKEQLSRWSQDELSATQRREVERLQTQAAKLQEVLQAILAFAEARKPNTIEKVLGKSDVEVAVDFLSGKLRR